MSVDISVNGEVTTAYLNGEIDHHTAANIRNAIDNAAELNMPSLLVLDFTRVSFMDSSGIGLIMGRYARMKAVGGELVVQRPNERIRRIFEMAGIERIVRIEEKGEEKHEA